MNIKDLHFFSSAILHEIKSRITSDKEGFVIAGSAFISIFLIAAMPGLQHLFNFCIFVYLAYFSRNEKKNLFISNLWILIAVFYIILASILY